MNLSAPTGVAARARLRTARSRIDGRGTAVLRAAVSGTASR